MASWTLAKLKMDHFWIAMQMAPQIFESDCDADGIPDGCELDQDGDGLPDDCDDDDDNDGIEDG